MKIFDKTLQRLSVNAFVLFIFLASIQPTTSLAEPLRVHSGNPRYFTDGSGKAIYLTGWNNGRELQDNAWTDYGNKPTVTDYLKFLDSLKHHNHNYIRMWVVEHSKHTDDDTVLTSPMPYLRTGPGNANDGEPKFDLYKFNEAYFDRLRSRVMAARDQGIYVSIMLFQGWSVDRRESYEVSRNSWPYNPFHTMNNVNDVNGDSGGDGQGEEVHTLQNSTVTIIQEAYVKKVIDAVNDLDNVLYEIANEGGVYSQDWQYHMIRFIKAHEAKKPKQHPIGITGGYLANSVLTISPADWISPGAATWSDPNDPWISDPPAADGTQVSITDTDHIVGARFLTTNLLASIRWVWKSFMRGHNPSLLARLTSALGGALEDSLSDHGNFELIRKALGQTRSYAEKIDLTSMLPRSDLVSSGYALVNPGVEYLVYLPVEREVTVDLSDNGATFSVEWGNTISGNITKGVTVKGSSSRKLTTPYPSDSILYLKKSSLE